MENVLRNYIVGAVIWVLVGNIFGLWPHETLGNGPLLAAAVNALMWPIAAPVGVLRVLV
jgi:hypothetical protein